MAMSDGQIKDGGLIMVEALRFELLGDGTKSVLIGRTKDGDEVAVVFPSQALPQIKAAIDQVLHQF